MTTTARIADLLGRHPLIDGHNDLPWAHRALAGYDLSSEERAALLKGDPSDLHLLGVDSRITKGTYIN